MRCFFLTTIYSIAYIIAPLFLCIIRVKLANNGFVNNELFISEDMFSEYSQKYGYPQEGDLMVTGVGTLGICYLVCSASNGNGLFDCMRLLY